MPRKSSRRQFLKHTGAVAGAGFWIAMRGGDALGAAVSANDQLAIGVIGVANRGRSNMNELLKVKSARIVAVCDVDEKNLDDVAEVCPNAKQYTDFRKMLEAEKGLDAVVIATADHCHAAGVADGV